jgi:Protein of unknown function (DUF3551)
MMNLPGRYTGDPTMRYGIVAAAALTAVLAAALSSTGAQAEQWCGYAAAQDNALIQCGYSTVADCQTATGKGGTCFVDPYLALRTRRPAVLPVNFTPAR